MVSSGWNWTARVRPSVQACEQCSLQATSSAPGGSTIASLWNWNHGPGGTSAGSDVVTSVQPISQPGARVTPPPRATDIACPPKQIPSTGTPASCACRSMASSGASQEPIVAWSSTDHGAPIGTTTSKPRASGNSCSTSGVWNRSGGTTSRRTTSNPRAASRSPTRAGRV
jgi:hypothetical protein